jgi:hypothetical protein
MNRTVSPTRNFADRLIACETTGKQSSKTRHAAGCHVSKKLRLQLTSLMGNAGFRALLARALALASKDIAWLSAVNVNADGTLEGFDKPAAQIDPEKLAEGSVVLLTHLLGLLVAFIGEGMTLQLVRDIWPNIPSKDPNFGNGVHNENAN